MPKATPISHRRRPLGPQVKVMVSAEQINTSTRSHSSHCMIAEAIKTAVPSARHVAVDISTCRFSDPDRGLRYVYVTPRSAQEALVDFDEGLSPKPFAFTLRGAHVTRSGHQPSAKEKAKKASRRHQVPNRRVMVETHGPKSGALPRMVGGRRPPQLHLRREFGLRAFRAASLSRLAADAQNAIADETEG